jgi:BirA family transcriptional regulator, biotin operon repressor / biotin---[acetyl-CoA-carboxylase] ligase
VAQPFRSIILEEVGSTNAEAFKRAAAGDTGPLWVVARRQTQGRGRSGRQWASEPGNLYASLLRRLACPQAIVHQLSLVAGVAVVEAITGAAGRRIAGLRLKWPNDVLIGEAKCAGILAESQSAGTAAEVIVVIGIGTNLVSHPPGLLRAATDLASHGLAVSPETMLANLATSLERWLAIWDCGRGFAEAREAWLANAGAIGEGMTVDTGRERIAGTFLGLDPAGALLLRDGSGRERKLAFGDVTLEGPVPTSSPPRAKEKPRSEP